MKDILGQTHEMIDRLKAVCTAYGLGNTGNEYKIITETFLYKFLNDKFLHEIIKHSPKYKSKTIRDIEKELSKMSEGDFDLFTWEFTADTAIFKPTHLISHLFKQQSTEEFHKLFDDTLNDISKLNEDIFSVKVGEGVSVKLFEPISNYVVQPDRRDDFCRAIINKLVDVNLESIFEERYDFFADIFEYLIKDYNKDFGKYAEYYTPHTIAEIIARILITEPVKSVRIYDPAAGSGTLILALAHAIGEGNCTLYTQDISQKSNELLRLNLILHERVQSLPNVIQDDTLVNPRHRDKRTNDIATFDYVVSNPPFNMDFSSIQGTLTGNGYRSRFFAGVPNVPNKKKDGMAIYQLFLQHIIKSMNERGKAAVVVPTGFLTAATGIPLKIRQHIIDNKMLRGVISMPSNIFANTGTNVSVIFLDKNPPIDDKVLLVDASNLGTKKKAEGNKNQRTYLSKVEIDRIVDTFNARREEDDFSVLVSFDEIKQKNFSFSAGQYFKVKIEYVDLSPAEFEQKLRAFRSDLNAAFEQSHRLEQSILNQLEALHYEEN